MRQPRGNLDGGLSLNHFTSSLSTSCVSDLLAAPKGITQPLATGERTVFTDLPLYFKLHLPGLLLAILEKSSILQM